MHGNGIARQHTWKWPPTLSTLRTDYFRLCSECFKILLCFTHFRLGIMAKLLFWLTRHENIISHTYNWCCFHQDVWICPQSRQNFHFCGFGFHQHVIFIAWFLLNSEKFESVNSSNAKASTSPCSDMHTALPGTISCVRLWEMID